ETPGPAITLLGNTEVDVTGGGLLLESSALGYFSHTMIGHGGRNFSGGMSGNVRVDVLAGNISLLGGGANASSRYNHSQIGHGGYGNGTTLTATGNITVETDEGNLGIVAGHNVFSYAQIGHGGGRAGVASQSDLSGNVTARASGDITATGGSSSYTYAQIGHGGTASNADNTWHLGGTIEVEAGGGVTASGGTSSYTYSQ